MLAEKHDRGSCQSGRLARPRLLQEDSDHHTGSVYYAYCAVHNTHYYYYYYHHYHHYNGNSVYHSASQLSVH